MALVGGVLDGDNKLGEEFAMENKTWNGNSKTAPKEREEEEARQANTRTITTLSPSVHSFTGAIEAVAELFVVDFYNPSQSHLAMIHFLPAATMMTMMMMMDVEEDGW